MSTKEEQRGVLTKFIPASQGGVSKNEPSWLVIYCWVLVRYWLLGSLS